MSERELVLKVRVTDDPNVINVNGVDTPASPDGNISSGGGSGNQGGGSNPNPPAAVVPVNFNDDRPASFGFDFGRDDKGVNSVLDLGLPSGSGPFRFVFNVGGEVALDSKVSDHGGYHTVTTLEDQFLKPDSSAQYADKVDGEWVPRKGYEDVVAQLLATGLEDHEYGVFPKEIRGANLTGVKYDGRHTQLDIYNRDGLFKSIKMNGKVPPKRMTLMLVQAGVTEQLHYIWD